MPEPIYTKDGRLGRGQLTCLNFTDFGTPHPWIPGETVVTCDYYPSGNVVGQLPYKVGPPCSKCASGKGWCYKNLCRECKDFSPKCGKAFTKSMCLTQRNLMEKHCPQMCNLCQCPLKCKNRGQINPKTCTCRCHGKWKGIDCSEKICDPGWYGENCEKRCQDKVGTSTCKWRVQNGHPCSVTYMKYECFKTCVCDLMPKPTTNPPPTKKPTKPTSTQVPIKTTPTQRPPPTTDCQDTAPRHCQFWSNLGQCKKQSKWMRENCKKSCGVCTCQDIHNTANCKRWATVGECNKNPTWMEVNCPRSCLVCDCHNKNTKCSQWAKKAFCNDNQYAVWMAKNCKKSCNKC
ncbi:PREDICTED: putative tyrosinase-like protein tyr-3 [Acropora digitifera]|uniref:putative tyrosinase-like protein tyr-3 n=1 Tax=Acropora digitifera TaxID=70779 RepID=UPI00077B0DF9|nr:PREDICTED: putative tyrosinase-like protein tyr-3 [Acropora digitifera]